MDTRKLRILFVTYGLPYPPHGGSRVRDFNLIKHVSHHHSVLLLSLAEFPEEVNHLPRLEQYCDLVDVVPTRGRSKLKHMPGVMRCLIAGRPLETYFFFYDELASKIRETVITWDVDIVQIEQSFLAPYVEALPAASRSKKIVSFENLGFIQYRRMLNLKSGTERKLRFLLNWILMRHWEPKYAERFDRSVVVSSLERQVLQSANSNLRVSVVENGVDAESLQPLSEASEGSNLLFVGTMNYPPNEDAVLYFCNAILPLVQREVPQAKLIVVGRNLTLEVRKLAAREDVFVTGHVPDVVPYYQQSRVSVVPLRAGGGTRLKVLESMALGRPVVSSSVGCEGLDVVDDRHILIADDPELFAEKTVRLLTERTFYQRIVGEARKLAVARYDWDAIAAQLLSVYSEVAQ
jgi:sugar transferase (PEP-CTERM/EpsH1 system associated)